MEMPVDWAGIPEMQLGPQVSHPGSNALSELTGSPAKGLGRILSSTCHLCPGNITEYDSHP